MKFFFFFLFSDTIGAETIFSFPNADAIKFRPPDDQKDIRFVADDDSETILIITYGFKYRRLFDPDCEFILFESNRSSIQNIIYFIGRASLDEFMRIKRNMDPEGKKHFILMGVFILK